MVTSSAAVSGVFARQYGADLCEPVRRLQNCLITVCDLLHESRGLVRTRFAFGILQQPLNHNAGVNGDSHGRPAVRDIRICSSDSNGRCRRRCVKIRKISSRRFRCLTSAMALRIKSAMTALLFCEPNTLSNSALMSSGTLKFTVAIPRAYAIVEIFNNAMVPRNA
jgi:hypothetical protein